MLLDNAANYPKEEMSNRFFTAMFGEGLLSAEPAMWRRHRKIMAPSFDPRSIASYAPAMAAASQAFAAHWDGLPDGADVDMAEEMKALTLRIICETMFSSDAAELVRLAGAALGFSRDALNFGILDLLPVIGPMRLKAKQAALHEDFGAMDGAIYRMIEERERNLADAPNDLLLTRLVAASDPEDGRPQRAQEVRDELITPSSRPTRDTAVAMTFPLQSALAASDAKPPARRARRSAGRTRHRRGRSNLPITRQSSRRPCGSIRRAPRSHGRRPSRTTRCAARRSAPATAS